MRTVHMIGNAHLDPVWLWRREDGVDAALATARSACDRLDEYRQFIFTCSASWMHVEVERIDPTLFERIRRFVDAGRWQIVGGMVIQPDCNLPSAESFRKQLEHGQRYFRDRLGEAATVGYNVDSFGHTAYLPRFLQAAGIDAYAFMRPGPNEKRLPSSLFRWRSPDGAEVTAFRIAGSYSAREVDLRKHVGRALAAMPEATEHTMCFFGVGDHGGGPTKQQIEWILANADSIDGARLVISHPRAFFDAVADLSDSLPVVTGELQHHAIGCYSVERRLKVAMRRAEAGLVAAEQAVELFGGDDAAACRNTLRDAWDDVLFNQFHDVLGGTSLDRASRLAAGQLVAAEATAERVTTTLCRRAFRAQTEPGVHKIIVLNTAPEAFEGLVSHEPWMDFHGSGTPLALFGEDGSPVRFQCVECESMTDLARRVLMDLSIPPRASQTLTFVHGADAEQVAGGFPASGGRELRVEPTELGNDFLDARLTGGAVDLNGWTVRMELMDDPTDTWSHSAANRFKGRRLAEVDFVGSAETVEAGPVRAALRTCSEFASSRLWCRIMMLDDRPELHLKLAVTWTQVRQMLRLRIEPPGTFTDRTDLVSGGPLERPIDSLEYPLNGGLLVRTGDETLGIVAPEVLSAAVEPQAVNLTLLRSPYTAHHDPAESIMRGDQPVCDQGVHNFEIILRLAPDTTTTLIDRLAKQALHPPIAWDLTG